MIYLLTVIGLSPCGNSTVNIYTQTIHWTTQTTTERHNFGASNSRNNIYEIGHNFLFCTPLYKILHNRIPWQTRLPDCYMFRCLFDLQFAWTTVSALILGQLRNVCINWAGTPFLVTYVINSVYHVAFKWLSTVYYDLVHLKFLTHFLLKQRSPACAVAGIAGWPRICITHGDSENYFCLHIRKGLSSSTAFF